MAQTGYSVLSIYNSSTAAAVPTAGNLVAGELAINTADGKLFYKDSSGVVQTIATKGAGTVAGSTGYVQYNNAGALGASSNFYWDITNSRLGIGTTAPGSKLQVNGIVSSIGSGTSIFAVGETGTYTLTGVTSPNYGIAYGTLTGGANPAITVSGYDAIAFGTSQTERMRIDSSGNVGIGTSSPAEKLTITTSGSNVYTKTTDGTVNLYVGITNSSATAINGTISNHPYAFFTNNTERMRIDSSGNVFMSNTTLYPGDGNTATGFMFQASAGKIFVSASNGNTAYNFNLNGTGAIGYFCSSGTRVGNISVTGSATAYNTSSDYRLKENIAPMTGALETVAQLKPVTYNWKADGSDGQGFIAHELQAVVPDCVTGEKDGMRTEIYEISPLIPAEIDEDGKVIKEAVEAVMGEREVPEYQGIDTSFLVATLTAAIQELTAKVTALEAKVG